MAVPKSRHTKSRRDKRRMHIYLEEPSLMTCLKCGKKKRPHRVCPYCGFYKGREVVNVMGKMEKEKRKLRQKEIREREKEKAKKAPRLDLKELSK